MVGVGLVRALTPTHRVTLYLDRRCIAGLLHTCLPKCELLHACDGLVFLG